MRAYEGTYLPRRRSRKTLLQLVTELGWGFSMVDHLLRNGVIVREGRFYVFQ